MINLVTTAPRTPILRISKQSGIPYHKLYRLARSNGIKRYVRTKLPADDEQVQFILSSTNKGLSLIQIARLIGWSKSSVHKVVVRHRAVDSGKVEYFDNCKNWLV